LGLPAVVEDPLANAQLIVVRVADNEATVSIDSSGDPLYKRGWRVASTKAPLRETLAAAMLLETGWDASVPLADPFCGSGTIAIEAALLATGRAPGAIRSFAFENWPSFEPGTLASVRGELRAASSTRATATRMPIFATDRDEGAIAIAVENAARAGVDDAIEFRHASVSELGGVLALGRNGWIVTNPPYGRRLATNDDLRNLFARFGDVVRSSLADWHVGILVADERVAGHAGLALTRGFSTSNGGIGVRFLVGSPPWHPGGRA
jgi:putative N6-adenine-specific DNA methylase